MKTSGPIQQRVYAGSDNIGSSATKVANAAAACWNQKKSLYTKPWRINATGFSIYGGRTYCNNRKYTAAAPKATLVYDAYEFGKSDSPILYSPTLYTAHAFCS